MRHNDSGHRADIPARDVTPVTPQQLRAAASALERSYPSVRQYGRTLRDAAAYVELLERRALGASFERRAVKGRRS